jgi:hypothetical protein
MECSTCVGLHKSTDYVRVFHLCQVEVAKQSGGGLALWVMLTSGTPGMYGVTEPEKGIEELQTGPK